MTASKAGCKLTERVSEYVLCAFPASERASLEKHIHECQECGAELDTLRPVIDTFVDWPAEILRPPTPLWDRLSERIAADTGCERSSVPEARWADEPEWSEVAPGIACKLLATDEARGRVSMLVRLAPGCTYPAHCHTGVEELHLLHGELWIDERKLSQGDYYRAEPSTVDTRVWSETGCTCVLMTSFHDVLG